MEQGQTPLTQSRLRELLPCDIDRDVRTAQCAALHLQALADDLTHQMDVILNPLEALHNPRTPDHTHTHTHIRRRTEQNERWISDTGGIVIGTQCGGDRNRTLIRDTATAPSRTCPTKRLQV